MPTKDKHLDIIDRNYKTLIHLSNPEPSDYTEWCIIIIYYMAFHYIQAYLDVNINEHPSSHAVLQNKIKDINQLKPLYGKYRQLEDDSRKARYEGHDFTIYSIRSDNLKNFQEIQNMIFTLLNIQDRQKYDLYKLFPLKKA
ncbi:MAG: hypothetical protein V2I97_04840 [Desulfococcaceae bacterium]|jgi:hypothetical protein|nr:hypothetical protein [Desulfococcaceae bacterium]